MWDGIQILLLANFQAPTPLHRFQTMDLNKCQFCRRLMQPGNRVPVTELLTTSGYQLSSIEFAFNGKQTYFAAAVVCSATTTAAALHCR
ncbi:hypothetical protein L1987_08226 [Smallanthus sonchifolius]|uniref:Uncharacterized protein n=1 Tax=Smallanthus sonchifolius TaxID=185202 RepID=A0ACB9JL75_9ASTR|nr:hypothetical protein L1987_08226 [Smallanthus sonchifolius]